YEGLYFLNLKDNDAIYSQNNDVVLFTDGNDKFNALIDDLEKAADHFHKLYYIVSHDRIGNKIAIVQIEKTQEVEKIRFIYDDMGSILLSSGYIRRMEAAGINVGALFPPKIPKLNFKINFRNHRKLAIIDGKIGYIGGFNIGDEYLGESEKFGYWR